MFGGDDVTDRILNIVKHRLAGFTFPGPPAALSSCHDCDALFLGEVGNAMYGVMQRRMTAKAKI